MSRQAIENLVSSFNDAWVYKKYDLLEPILHEEVIFVTSDFTTLINGKQACKKTIEEYGNMASTEVFNFKKPQIHIWDKTGNVTIDYYVEYVIDGEKFQETGKEFWTVTQVSNAWRLVSRLIIRNETK